MNKNTKRDISLTLEGDDAIAVLRALGKLGHTKPKKSKPEKVKKLKEKKKSKPKKRGRPKGSKKQPKPTGKLSQFRRTINGKRILNSHIGLADVFLVNEERNTLPTAKEAARIAGVTLNKAYSFAYRHGVKWTKGYAKRSKK